MVLKNINARLPKRSGGQAENAEESQRTQRIIEFLEMP
jgi:hypothetical protein